MNDREELGNIMDSYHAGGYGDEYEAILAWHTAKLNEARVDELMNVRLRPMPYTDRGDADKYIVIRLAQLQGDKES